MQALKTKPVNTDVTVFFYAIAYFYNAGIRNAEYKTACAEISVRDGFVSSRVPAPTCSKVFTYLNKIKPMQDTKQGRKPSKNKNASTLEMRLNLKRDLALEVYYLAGKRNGTPEIVIEDLINFLISELTDRGITTLKTSKKSLNNAPATHTH